MTYADDVRDFMTAFSQPVRDATTVPEWVDKRTHRLCATAIGYLNSAHEFAQIAATNSGDERALSIRLILEEVLELVKAIVDGDEEQILDGSVDASYIAVGIAHRFGLPFDAAWREIHSSNMSKLHDGKPVLDSSGKVVKPATYSPPDILGVLDGRIK